MDANVLLVPGSQLTVLTQQPLRGTPWAGDRALAGPESSATRFLLQPGSLDEKRHMSPPQNQTTIGQRSQMRWLNKALTDAMPQTVSHVKH